MIIKKNKEIVNRITELSDVNDLNMSLSNLFLNMVGTYDKEIINKLVKNDNVKDTFLEEIALSLDIDLNNQEDSKLWEKYVKASLFPINSDIYKNNEYLKNIRFENKINNTISIGYDHYEAYEIFPLNDIVVDDNYIEHTQLAFFNHSFEFPVINENDVTWMSVNPNEINTMDKAIEAANGNVIVFGLGLGYFPYMISLKKDVKKITIIENNQRIIDVFKKYILPQFKNKDKISIINTNALNFNKFDGYNFAFVDLWHSAEDGILTYLKFKSMEKKNLIYFYWLENSFYALLRRAMITLLTEQLNGYDKSNYKNDENVFDKIVNLLYKNTVNLEITNLTDLENILKDESLLKLCIM